MTEQEFKNNSITTNIIVIIVAVMIFIGYLFYNNMNGKLEAANAKIEKLQLENGSLVEDLAKAKDEYVTLETKAKNQTSVVYVEKTSEKDGDFEVNKKIPKVVINAGDGYSYEYSPDSKSYQNIKDGKMVITEEKSLTLDIERIVNDRFKDKIEALNAKHEIELNKVNAELKQTQDKLKITRKQRDFYAGCTITTVGTGAAIVVKKSL